MKTLFVILILTLPVLAGEVYTPKTGSKGRVDLLNAVRDPLEDRIHQEVVVRVSHLKEQDGWAFLIAQARTKDHKPIDYKGAVPEWGTSEVDEGVIAILRYKRKRWDVVQHSYFTSDVWWDELHKKLRAPGALFNLSKLKK
ncbi:MAG: hypothetical protein OSB65_11730 [Roseibacillus sp.]|nr:hypothetical protein [Roseibacillus sp.]